MKPKKEKKIKIRKPVPKKPGRIIEPKRGKGASYHRERNKPVTETDGGDSRD